MSTREPSCNRLVDEIAELSAEVKRLRMLFFERRECKNGCKGDWCSDCDLLDADDDVCAVDRETAPVYAEDEK